MHRYILKDRFNQQGAEYTPAQRPYLSTEGHMMNMKHKGSIENTVEVHKGWDYGVYFFRYRLESDN